MNRVLFLNMNKYLFSKMNSDQKQNYYVGGRQFSNTNNIRDYEKFSPKTRKLVKINEGACSICGRNKSEKFVK